MAVIRFPRELAAKRGALGEQSYLDALRGIVGALEQLAQRINNDDRIGVDDKLSMLEMVAASMRPMRDLCGELGAVDPGGAASAPKVET